MKLIKGDSVEKQIKHIDTILSRMLRRMHKTVVAVTAPVPVFNYLPRPEADGTLLRAILPKGRIIRGFMYVGQYEEGKQEVGFTAAVTSPGGGMSRDFATRKPLFVVDPDIPVETGARLRFWTHSPELIKDIWVGFLIQVGVKDSYKEQFILDELEANYLKNKEEVEMEVIKNG